MFAPYTSPGNAIMYYKTCSILIFPVNTEVNIWDLLLYSHKFIFADVRELQNLFPYT